MLANAVEQLGNRSVVQIGQIGPIERRAGWKVLRQIKAERYFALKPRLDRVSIGRNHLRRQASRERSDVLIEDLGNQRIVLSQSKLRFSRVVLHKHNACGDNQKHPGGDAQHAKSPV